MADNSKIEWTHHTWNPTRGCRRVSPGCENCYAEGIAARFSGDGLPFEGYAVRTAKGPRWTGKAGLIAHKLVEPLRKRVWRGKRVFVDSMSDLFYEGLADDAIDQVFAVMALCPEVTFQVLTKRPERMQEYLTAGFVANRIFDEMKRLTPKAGVWVWPGWDEAFANVWLGVSVESQEYVERARILRDVPAAVRFLSCEPLLGPLDLSSVIDGIDWVIAGGESGPGARRSDSHWFWELRDQCSVSEVPFFLKQITQRGFKVPFEHWPEELKVREFPNG